MYNINYERLRCSAALLFLHKRNCWGLIKERLHWVSIQENLFVNFTVDLRLECVAIKFHCFWHATKTKLQMFSNKLYHWIFHCATITAFIHWALCDLSKSVRKSTYKWLGPCCSASAICIKCDGRGQMNFGCIKFFSVYTFFWKYYYLRSYCFV